jgi:DNA-binding NtrC family response regulator
VGSSDWTPVDLLFIASTNRNLRRLAQGGDFLPDLANRLTTLVISIPPLRERREDIAPMVEYFAGEYARAYQIELRGVTPEALRILEGEAWPGNVRELSSVMENAVFRSTNGTVDAEVLSEALGRQGTTNPAPDERQEIAGLPPEARRTEAVIRRALEACDWNGAAAAELLGIPLRTFRRYLSNFNIRKKFD